MTKCEKCNQEIPNKTVVFKDLKIEVDFIQQQNNKMLKDIKIPKGWRLLRFNELDAVMNFCVDNKLQVWSYFEQPIKIFKNKYVAGFGADSGWVDLICDRNPTLTIAGLGVVLCKDVK